MVVDELKLYQNEKRRADIYPMYANIAIGLVSL